MGAQGLGKISSKINPEGLKWYGDYTPAQKPSGLKSVGTRIV